MGQALLVLFALLAFLDLACGQTGPTLLNGTRYFQKSKIVTTNWEVVPIALTFDEDLYLNEGLLCPYPSQACSPITCTPCDWTVIDEGLTCQPENCCGPFQDSASNIEDNLKEWCQPATSFERIDLFKNSTTAPLSASSSTHSLAVGETSYFRFFLHEELLCAPVRVAVRMQAGTVNVYLSNRFALPSNTENDDMLGQLNPTYPAPIVDLCPNWDVHYSPGTYSVGIEAVYDTTFYLEIIVGPTVTVAASPEHTCASTAAALPSTVTCIDDGVTYEQEFNTTDLVQYAFPIDAGCHIIAVSIFPTYDDWNSKATDPDLYCVPPVTGATQALLENSLIESWRNGPDMGTLAICASAPTVLLCAVQSYTPGHVLTTFSTTAYIRRTLITSPSPYEFGVVSQSVRLFQGTEHGSSKYNWCDPAGFPVSPSENPIFFYPAPFEIATRFETIRFSEPPPESYQFSAAVANRVDFLATLFSDYPIADRVASLSQLEANGRLYFATITNAAGIPPQPEPGELVFSVAIQDVPVQEPTCNPVAYAAVLEQLNSLLEQLQQALTVSEVLQLRFDIDAIQAAAPFQACAVQLYSMLEDQVINATTITEVCPYDKDAQSHEYYRDPCCSTYGLPFGCCIAQTATITVDSYSVSNGSDFQQCSSSQCAESYFEDLSSALNVLQTGLGCAETSIDEMNNSADQLIDIQRQCRISVGLGQDFVGNQCRLDSDCQSPPHQCNMAEGVCWTPPLANASLAFVKCFIANMPTSFADWLTNQEYPSLAAMATNSSEFLDAVLELANMTDCIGYSPLNMSTRSRWIFSTGKPACEASILAVSHLEQLTSCDPVNCLDQSCYVPASQCLRACTASWRYSNRTEASCPTSETTCSITATDSCASDLEGTHQCAYCPPDGSLPCTLVGGYSNQDDCESAVICESPSGEWITGLTIAECMAIEARCSVGCLLPEPVCGSYRQLEGVCQFGTSEAACQDLVSSGAEFVDGGCFSTTIADASSCLAASGTWQTCSGLSSCSVATPAGMYLQCLMWPWGPCDNQTSCEGSGHCSDREYTVSLDSTASTMQLAACFSSGTAEEHTFDRSIFCGFSDQRTPNGCLVSLTEDDCTRPGFVDDIENTNVVSYQWRTAAMTEEQCLTSFDNAGYGCMLPSVREIHTLWYDSETCLLCDGQPQSPWTWRTGRWVSAQPRALQWVKAKTVPKYTWAPTINFDTFSQWTRRYAEYRVSFGLRSAGICSFETLTSPLSVLACSCLNASTSGNEDCFKASSQLHPVALSRPCVQEHTSFRTPSSFVTFFTDSINSLCTIVAASEVEQSSLKAADVHQSVSFQLAVGKLPSGVVRNSGGREVGQLNSNGLRFDIANPKLVDYFEVCLLVVDQTTSWNSTNNIPDFGVSTDLKVVVPMGLSLKPTLKESQNFWCSNITSSQIEGQPTFFAVYRTDDFESGVFDAYTTMEINLSYALGAMFIVVALVILIFAVNWLRDGKFLVFSYLIAVPLFLCLVVFRIVYCFALPSGIWTDNQVASFIVFELPSFFYFSACCCVLFSLIDIVSCFWKKFRRRAQILLLSLLVSAWCLFVAVAVADAVLITDNNTESECPGRVASTSNVNSKLRTLSIAYQSILICLIFLLAAFVFFLMTMVFRKALTAHKNQERALGSLQEMLKDGLCVSFGFLVRCILFVVYLSLELNSPVFIFVTLTVTEVLIILFLLGFWMLRFHNDLFSFSSSSAASTELSSLN